MKRFAANHIHCSRIVACNAVPGSIPNEIRAARGMRDGVLPTREEIDKSILLRKSIYRVPSKIRSIDPTAFAPLAAGIGPFNPFFHSKRAAAIVKLKETQDDKKICVEKFMPEGDSSRFREVCFAAMKKLEGIIRASYSDQITMSSDELANAMLLDGFFILDLLLNHSQDTQLISDLLLLENQIPFFVVVQLLKLHGKNCEPLNLDEPHELDKEGKILAACGLKLFKSIHPDGARVDPPISASFRQVHHLLHLFYQSIPESAKPSQSSTKDQLWIPNAKKLHDAGVRFKTRTDASSFLDIKYSKGIMKIPPLELHDRSNSLFRNLIAFEQCYPETDFRVTIYAAFMDCLLKSPDDTRELYLSGILTNNFTTDQDAAHFFSSVCNQVHYATDNSYLRDLCLDVNKYPRSIWSRLFRNHFNR